MSNDALNWAVAQRVTPSQKLVLMVLANRADGDWRCWPSVKKLAEECSLSERSVQYTIRALSASGTVSVFSEPGKASVYQLNRNTPATGAGVQDVQGCNPCTGATGAGVQDVHQGGATGAPGGCNLCSPTRASSYEPKEEPKENPQTRAREGEKTQDDFSRFWAAYPRKVGKKAALKAWKNAKDKPPIDAIIAALERQRASPQWLRDGGQFIPHPATWINQGRWDDCPVEIKTTGSPRTDQNLRTAQTWAERKAGGLAVCN